MADSDEAIFLAPRRIEFQERLDFLSVPPDRIIAFAHEADEFVGVKLHWHNGESFLCLGESCKVCMHETTPPREYFFTDCYLYCHGTRDFKPFLLPVGGDLGEFFAQSLVGQAWRVSARKNAKEEKKGLRIARVDCTKESAAMILGLQPFDIRPRLRKRYHFA